MTTTRVAVVGAGAWGTTLAHHLARKGHDVALWAYEPEVAAAIAERHENPLYLPGRALDPALSATHDLGAAVAGARCVVAVPPSHAARPVLAQVAPALAPGAIVVSATKGIEARSLALMTQVAEAVLPGAPVVALSGPSFAAEVHEGQPTAVVAASRHGAAATLVQDLFATSRFRVYTSADVTGVELGGALKNVIAIAAGVLEGLGLGHNPRAALLTRGLAEIGRLGVAMGADPLTFAGLAGMGDLILTCTGGLSRNRQLGLALAHGTSFAQWAAEHRQVAEGAMTSEAAVALAARHGVELPIAHEVSQILFHGRPARESLERLMERTLKAEQWR